MQALHRIVLPITAAAFIAATAISAPNTQAAADCPGAGQSAVQVGAVSGAVEGLIVDSQGRAYATDLVSGQSCGSMPRRPCGSHRHRAQRRRRCARLDPRRHTASRLRRGRPGRHRRPGPAGGHRRGRPRYRCGDTVRLGLSAANGMDVAADGTVYATNDFGNLVGRVSPNGAVQADWRGSPAPTVPCARHRRRIPLYLTHFRQPWRQPDTHRESRRTTIAVGPVRHRHLRYTRRADLDSQNRPVVPFNLSGRIVRIDSPGRYCVLGTAAPSTSVVTYGRGTTGFSAGRLFAATFTGAIYEIPGAFDSNA